MTLTNFWTKFDGDGEGEGNSNEDRDGDGEGEGNGNGDSDDNGIGEGDGADIDGDSDGCAFADADGLAVTGGNKGKVFRKEKKGRTFLRLIYVFLLIPMRLQWTYFILN